jgi:hypothetical protein
VAKANLTRPDGTTVAIEGTANEVAALLAKISSVGPTTTGGKKRSRLKTNSKTGDKGTAARKGTTALIQELANESWFKSKRTIGDVQKKLEEKGHIYAISSLSTPLLRLTRSRVLRRIQDKTGWTYVS